MVLNVVVLTLSHVPHFVTLWTVAHRAPLPMAMLQAGALFVLISYVFLSLLPAGFLFPEVRVWLVCGYCYR